MIFATFAVWITFDRQKFEVIRTEIGRFEIRWKSTAHSFPVDLLGLFEPVPFPTRFIRVR